MHDLRGMALLCAALAAISCGDVENVEPDAAVTVDAMQIDGAATGDASLEIDMTTHDFGTLLTDTSSLAVVFTISNTGDDASGNLTASLTGTDAAQFDLSTDDCSGAPLAAAASCQVAVVFEPTEAGNATATLEVSADPGGEVSAALEGSAAAPGALSMTPDDQPFGTAVVGTPSGSTLFTVMNTGDTTTGTLTVSRTGTDMGDFTISNDNCTGNTLAGSASCTFEAAFVPTSGGTKMAMLAVTGDPGGTDVSTVSGTGLSPALLTIDDTVHDFGGVVQGGTSSQKVFTITNTGDQTSGGLTLSKQGTDPGQFDIVSQDCDGATLPKDARCTVTMTYSPSAATSHAALLQVAANPGGTAEADLSGTGQTPPDITGSSASNNFGLIEVGTSSSSFDWVITNDGDAPTGTLALTNNNATAFPATNGCSSLVGGGSCTISVVFDPSAGGNQAATLTLTDAATGGSAVLSAAGHGGFRITVSKNGTGTGTVSSSPSGINCGVDCSEVVPMGTVVTLSAATANGSSSLFGGWSGAGCSGIERQCTVTVSSARTVTAGFNPLDHNLIFVSSGTFAANLGIAEYDTACNKLASNAGLNNATDDGYIAMISDSNSSAPKRLDGARGWVRMDGQPFADDLTGLFELGEIFYPIKFNENGQNPLNVLAFTGTNANGTVATGQTCGDWTTTTSGSGMVGGAQNGPAGWSAWSAPSCGTPRHLICMGNTRIKEAVPRARSGKLIYLTNTPLLVGREVPNTKCQEDGRNLGVASAKALLAYTGLAAEAALDPAADYVRPDGVFIGTGKQLIEQAELDSGMWQDAASNYVGMMTWVGTTDFQTEGTTTSTCDNWNDPQVGAGRLGHSSSTRTWWWGFGTGGCSLNARIYCIEQ